MVHKRQPTIIKADGQRVRFSVNKLIRSLRRSGAPRGLAKEIAHNVARTVTDGMSTKHIYREAKKQLKQHREINTLNRYSLKEAIHALGPTGFPFEQFLGALLKEHGYTTKTGVVMKGKCVSHEIDVVAKKVDEVALIEAKFHNQPGAVTDVKVPLYIHSRFRDVTANVLGDTTHYRPWIVTNTKFSKDAITYGSCNGMHLVGWRYPETGGLEYLVESTGLQPVTCLSSLSQADKQFLLKKGVVLCKTLLEQDHILASMQIPKAKQRRILNEVRGLCHGN